MKYRAIGDSVLGISSVFYLREIFPESEITYGVPSKVFPLYEKNNQGKDRFFSLSFESARDWWTSFLDLRREKFDLIIELHQSGRSGRFFKLYSLFSSTPYYYHNHNKKKGFFILDQGKHKANIQRDLDGIYSIACKGYNKVLPLPSYLDYPPRLFSRQKKEPLLILLGVSAGREEKRWPLEYFAELCRLLLKKDHRYRFLIAFSHSPLEKKMRKEWISFSIPHVCAKAISLDDLPSFIAKASWYIGNDSGIKHLAAAMGMRTYTFFGSKMEHPVEWHPYDTTQHLFFHPEKELKGNLFSDNHDPDKNFFTQLTPDKVVSSMNSHSFPTGLERT